MDANDCNGGGGKGEQRKLMMAYNGELSPKQLNSSKARYIVILTARSD